MSFPTSATGFRKRRQSSWLIKAVVGGSIGIGVVAFLMAAALAVWLSRSRYLAQKEVDDEIALAKSANEPIDLTELQRAYEVQRGDGSVGGSWMDACDSLGRKSFQSELQLFLPGGAKGPPDAGDSWLHLGEARNWLEPHRDRLNRVHTVADKGAVGRFPIQEEWVEDAVLQWLSDVRGACFLLQLEANIHAYEGNRIEAIRSLAAMMACSNCLATHPSLMSQLVRAGCVRTVCRTSQRLLSTLNFTDSELELLSEVHVEVDFRIGLRRGLIGERVSGIGFFQSNAPDNPEDLTFYLAQMRRAISATSEPWPESIAEAATIVADVDNLVDSGSLRTLARHRVSVMIIPALEAAFVGLARAEAANSTARVAVAIAAFQHKNNRLPKTLEELVPDYIRRVPRDPFDNNPLRYKVFGRGYAVYSVDEDRVDDGGQGRIGSRDTDIVFFVEPPRMQN